MSVKQKVDHLYRGLKPSLKEKVWMFKPITCDEFLGEVKRYQEPTSMADQREGAIAVLEEERATLAGGPLMVRMSNRYNRLEPQQSKCRGKSWFSEWM